MKDPILALLLFFSFTNLSSQHPKREMRAVWIATIANIDWPSSPNHSPYEQRSEMIHMLDELYDNNINTVVFQARPSTDAFYHSALEPWSKYLTGKQGKRPEPFYDPMQFVIDEAHKRCMEVHIWLNPYRVLNHDNTNSISSEHLFHKDRSLFLKYAGKYYFDPGLDETRIHLNNVVKDIVERYDIDAIHFDDYFYPYPEGKADFPDQESFRKNPRGFSNIADWRRNNVDLIIAELQKTIKSIKPWVEFGISPFGVWRNSTTDPAGSATRAGIQNYDDLYANILKWLKEGTIDYVVPQLYWEIGKKVADYAILIDWWSKNSYNKNLYIGLYASALEINKDPAWRKPNEIVRQLRLNRQFPLVSGAMFFSAKPFLKNIQGLNDSLKTSIYPYKAICPENLNLQGVGAIQPQNLRIIKDMQNSVLIWDKINEDGGSAPSYYIVYSFKGRKVGDLVNPANILTLTTSTSLNLSELKLNGFYTFVVTSVNRYRKESKPVYGITKKI